jgi:hypothetical protein
VYGKGLIVTSAGMNICGEVGQYTGQKTVRGGAHATIPHSTCETVSYNLA